MRTALLTGMTLLVGCAWASPEGTQDFADVYERMHTFVVTIRAKAKAHGGTGETRSIISLGSGVLISKQGSVLTAAHVVSLADEIEVEFTDGTVLSAKIISAESEPDIALLQLDRAPVGKEAARSGALRWARPGPPMLDGVRLL